MMTMEMIKGMNVKKIDYDKADVAKQEVHSGGLWCWTGEGRCSPYEE